MAAKSSAKNVGLVTFVHWSCELFKIMPKRKSSSERSPAKKKQQQTTTIDTLFARQRENQARNVQSLVSCPVCSIELPEFKINRHLDEDCRLEYLPSLSHEQGERNHQVEVEFKLSESPKRVRRKLSLGKRKETDEKHICSSVSNSFKRNLSLDLSKCDTQTRNISKSPYFPKEKVKFNGNRVVSQTSKVFSSPSTSKDLQFGSKQDEKKKKDDEDHLMKESASVGSRTSPKKRTVIVNDDKKLLNTDTSLCSSSKQLKQTETRRQDTGDSTAVYKTPEKMGSTSSFGSRRSVLSPRTNDYLSLIPKRFADIKVSLSPTKSARNNSQVQSSSSSCDDAMKYYLRNFLLVIKSVLDTNDDFNLFDEQDLAVVRNFFLLSGTIYDRTLLKLIHFLCRSFSLVSVKAQKLYVRLFTRKHFWILLSKMTYPEIDDDLEPVLRELHQNNLLECEDQLTCLKTILKLLMAPQIKELCKNMNIKNTNQKTTTENYILDHCLKQKSAVAGHNVARAVTKEAKRLLKRCCRLLETPRRVFIRVLMLHSLTSDTNDRSHEDRPFQLETILRVNMGLIVYPSYEMSRQAKIFRSRDDLMRYEKAYLLDGEITTAMENKDWNEADRLCSIALDDFLHLLHDKTIINHDANLPKFLSKFTAGHVYVLCLNQRIELLQRLRTYEEAVKQLEALLTQSFYCGHHRGRWFERIALNLEQHMHKPLEALRVIQEAFADPNVTMDHRLALHQRALRISSAKKNKTMIKKAPLNLPSIAIRDAPKIEIEGKKLNQSIPGYKTAFVATEFSESGNNVDVVLCSVEEFALSHYRTLGFSAGLHGEGSLLVSLFGLLFWDIVYQCDIPDAFRSQHQSFPLDLVTDDFYSNRKENIEGRLDLILNSAIEVVIDIMEKTWSDHEGQSSLVNWNLYNSFKRVRSLVLCMGNVFLANICKRFATNYRHYRAGVPDIVIWKPKTREWKMVEVKGPGDRLSNKQLIWLDYLLENDVSVEVCYVNAKKRNAKSKNDA